MAELALDSVSQSYGNRQIIADLTFTLPEGAIGCLLGPSGCGKTTALRCISGFEPIQSGEIRIGGETVSRPDWMLAAEKRRVGMVFQDYALFPHLTVANNVGFGLRGESRAGPRRRASPNCWNWSAWRNTPGSSRTSSPAASSSAWPWRARWRRGRA